MFSLIFWRYFFTTSDVLGLCRVGIHSGKLDPILLMTAWDLLSKSLHILLFSWFLSPWLDFQFQMHWSFPTAWYSHLHVSLWGLYASPVFLQHLWDQRALVQSHLTKECAYSTRNLSLGCPWDTSVWLEGVSNEDVEFSLVCNLTVHSCGGF